MSAVERRDDDLTGTIAAKIVGLESGLIAIRRDLHAHPELGFEVSRTADVVARELGRLGLPVRRGVGRTGVVAEIEGGASGRRLVIRADMDALPIEERTGLTFASRVPGLMHACGHDVHTATLIGAAAVLKDLAPALRGSVRLMFQPAEEIADGGALAMIGDGVLEGADLALGFHNDPLTPAGAFGYARGASMASADNFVVDVRGRSGHASSPHNAIDPVVAAAQLVAGLQTVVSREIDPGVGGVVTVAYIHGGTVDNVIPDSCRFGGTVRTLSPEARATAEAAFRRIVAGAEIMLRVSCEVAWRRGVPPVMNDDATLDAVVAAVQAQLGPVIAPRRPLFSSEDFAYVAERVPSAHLLVGSGSPGRREDLHSSTYQPDEACICLGAAALARAAAELLS